MSQESQWWSPVSTKRQTGSLRTVDRLEADRDFFFFFLMETICTHLKPGLCVCVGGQVDVTLTLFFFFLLHTFRELI